MESINLMSTQLFRSIHVLEYNLMIILHSLINVHRVVFASVFFPLSTLAYSFAPF